MPQKDEMLHVYIVWIAPKGGSRYIDSIWVEQEAAHSRRAALEQSFLSCCGFGELKRDGSTHYAWVMSGMEVSDAKLTGPTKPSPTVERSEAPTPDRSEKKKRESK